MTLTRNLIKDAIIYGFERAITQGVRLDEPGLTSMALYIYKRILRLTGKSLSVSVESEGEEMNFTIENPQFVISYALNITDHTIKPLRWKEEYINPKAEIKTN